MERTITTRYPARLAVIGALLLGGAVAADGQMLAKPLTASQLSQLLLRGNHKVTNSYRPLGGPSGHAGIDFGDIKKDVTSVYSPVSGTIVANTSACGKVAIYDGKNTIILAHMSSRTSLKENDTITAGTYVGKTSDVVGGGCKVDGPHLHIEIRVNKDPTMSEPANDNRKKNLDPLTYAYDQTAPSLSFVYPSKSNTSFSTGRSYTLSWSANDPSGLGDVSVELISASAKVCTGSPSPLHVIRLAGSGYVSSVKWTVPTSLKRGSYNLKVAVRDNLNNWGCVMTLITIQ